MNGIKIMLSGVVNVERSNGEGFICPECGLKHPYERMGNDGIHCIDCEQRYDY